MNMPLAAGLISLLMLPLRAAAAENINAMSVLRGSAAKPRLEAVPVYGAEQRTSPVSWTERVKQAYQTDLQSGTLAAMPQVPDSQLPEKAFQTLSAGLVRRAEGPGCAPRAYKFVVDGLPAYAVHSGCDGRGTAVRIFDKEGRLAASGSAPAGGELSWKNAGRAAHGHGQPDGDDDTWPSGGQDNSAGPDSNDDGGGCGGSDPGADGGYDGSGGLPF